MKVGKADDDITIGSTIMSLRDPLSGARVTNPARFKGTSGLVAFDLDTFLGMTKRTRKWQCPHSMRHARVQELQLDTYVARIIDSLAASLLCHTILSCAGSSKRRSCSNPREICCFGTCAEHRSQNIVSEHALAERRSFPESSLFSCSGRRINAVCRVLQEFPDVLEIEVSPDGEWRPSTGRYPWTQITDPLPAPLPEPVMVQPPWSLIPAYQLSDLSDTACTSCFTCTALLTGYQTYAKLPRITSPIYKLQGPLE